jgi:hypothetical protein
MNRAANDIKILSLMPFYNLTNYQLCLEFQIARVRYSDFLENNSFQSHLAENISENLLNTFSCKYFDEESFNRMIDHKNFNISLLHCNLQSSFRNYGYLKANLLNLKHQFSLIAITETGRSKLDILANLFEDYTFYSSAPVNNAKGGVGLYIKSCCTFSRRYDLALQTDLPVENIWFDINDSYIIGVIYRHPNNNVELFVQQLENTVNLIKQDNKPFILCGDFNIDLLKHDNTMNQLYIDTL